MSHKEVVAGMCFVLPFEELRNTPSVHFTSLPDSLLSDLAAVDLVEHQPGAKSPMIDGDDTRYWYMHPDQEDNLIVYKGKRIVELYTVEHGKVETFEVTPEGLYWNGQEICKGPMIFGWHENVFHRVHSPEGSLSMNFARHFKGFDLTTNFNIYKLDPESGDYEVARAGHLDQPVMDIGE